MVDPVVNKGKVTVSTGYNDTATSIVLASGQGAELPDPVVDGAYNLPWWDSTNYDDPADDPNYEIVRVTGPSGTGDTKTIVRAQEGTAATNKNNADATYKMHLGVTAKTITDLIAVEKCATVIVGKSGEVDYLTTDYGSDDACIQAAINYVDGLNDGSVMVREGTYTIESNVNAKSDVKIISHRGAVFSAAVGLGAFFSVNGIDNFECEGITFEGNSRGTKGFAISNSSTNIKIANNTFQNLLERVINATGYDYLTFTNNTVNNCGLATVYVLNIDASTDAGTINISSNIFKSIPVAPTGVILVKKASHVLLNDNSFITCKSICIYTKACTEMTISNNIMDVDYDGSVDWSAAIMVTDVDGLTENVTVSNNIIKLITNPVTYFGGILIAGESSSVNTVNNITVTGNSIDGGLFANTRPLIYSHGHASLHNTNVAIVGNTLYNGDDGIQMANTDLFTVSENTIKECGGCGAYISSSDNGVISSNVCINNGQGTTYQYTNSGYAYGIFLNNSDENIVSANQCIDTQGTATQLYGVLESGTSSGNKIVNNYCSGNDTAEILKSSSTTTTEINTGYNPVGAVGPPSVPATTVNYTNAYGYPCQVQVTGGTVTEIDIDDIATGLTSGMFIIPPGGTINITYSAAPSWRWWGL